jgi:hypothetical protein
MYRRFAFCFTRSSDRPYRPRGGGDDGADADGATATAAAAAACGAVVVTRVFYAWGRISK